MKYVTANKILEFIPFYKSDLDKAFNLYKSALYHVIEKAFGWDENFQKNRFETHYAFKWFNWIEIKSNRIGYVCYFQTEEELHVSLLIILKEFQNNGYGKIAMNQIEQHAFKNNQKVTLSSFKTNEAAINFYRSMGYTVTNEDEYFIDLSKS